MKTCTIANTQSGSWIRVKSMLQQLIRDTDTELVSALDAESMTDAIQQAVRDGCQRLIVAGGDGTLSRVVNSLGPARGDVELAVVPTGTGNDFARSIGMPLDSLDNAWRLAVEGRARGVDLVRVTNGSTSYLLNAATAGFGGKISTDVQSADKHRWGAAAYWMTAFSKLVDLAEYHATLELDNETITAPLYGLAIANGRYVGGGFPVAPRAWLNDHLLDVTTIPVLPTLELLGAGIDFTLGLRENSHGVMTYRSSYLRIHTEPGLPFSLDGEPTRSIDATFEIVPQALQVVTGPDAVAFCDTPTAAEQTAQAAS